MPSLSRIPLYHNAALLPGRVALEAWLMHEMDYNPHYARAIADHAGREGELSGAVAAGLLDREHEDDATEIFVESLADVPPDSLAWTHPGIYLDVDSLLEGGRPDRSIPPDAVLLPPELDPEGPYAPTAEDLADYGAWLEALDRDQMAALVAPIAGGAPFEPTAEDVADMEAHWKFTEKQDARRRAENARNALWGYE
jgi:hypothetical protein